MNLTEIAKIRLCNQQITCRELTMPEQIVSFLGAIQAQDYAGSKWAIGLRSSGVTDTEIEQAIIDRTILRTWPMRGTLHFVAAEDIYWMLPLLTPRIIEKSRYRQKQLELDDKTISQSREILIKALQNGNILTRKEMMAALEKAGISTEGQRGIHILWITAQEGLICFGPVSGKQQTFVFLDEWIPRTENITRDEALARLAERYFLSRGPATLKDFIWWSGLTSADARAGLDMIKSMLNRETCEGQDYWLKQNGQAINNNSSAVYLLPGFDEYILGYTDRRAALGSDFSDKVISSNGFFSPIIVVNEIIAGTWKKELKKETVIIKPDFFKPADDVLPGYLEKTARRYCDFLGIASDPVILNA